MIFQLLVFKEPSN